MEQLSEKLFDFLRTTPKSLYIPIVLAIGGLIFLSIGLIQLGSSKTNSENSQNPEISTQDVKAASNSASQFGLHVDVEGAVVHPGVYILPQNARLQDVLVVAGGLSSVADRDFVAKSLNLATKVIDGGKIYVPKIGEIPAGSSGVMQAGGSGTTSYLGSQVHLIDINSASSDELDSLPGIGPVTAQKIISGRPYSAINDLLAKKVVSQSVFDKIKDKVTVY
ncbi:MAG TPA: ComEA family DNA-binding protein [Patescibacteria group bacterium]|nr:ComEA family DNA-binding protein [Patescibacteria group bacterium]